MSWEARKLESWKAEQFSAKTEDDARPSGILS
jgi:hypothetical protein